MLTKGDGISCLTFYLKRTFYTICAFPLLGDRILNKIFNVLLTIDLNFQSVILIVFCGMYFAMCF